MYECPFLGDGGGRESHFHVVIFWRGFDYDSLSLSLLKALLEARRLDEGDRFLRLVCWFVDVCVYLSIFFLTPRRGKGC